MILPNISPLFPWHYSKNSTTFWVSDVDKAKVLYRHRTGNPEVTFLLGLVMGVCDSRTEYSNCAAHGTETHDFGSTKQLLCLQGQPGCAGDMAVFTWGAFGWIWSAELRLTPRELLWVSEPHSPAGQWQWQWQWQWRWQWQWQWHGLPTCGDGALSTTLLGALLLSLVTSNVFHRVGFVVWVFLYLLT